MSHQKIDIKNLDRTRFELDVISYSLPKFNYNTLSTHVDGNGEIHVVETGYENTLVRQSMFLYWLQTDLVTGECHVEGINCVNAFLLDLRVNDSQKDISIYSRGLIHYFSKLSEWGLDWRDMPHTQSRRPTYRFKAFLEESYRSSDKSIHIAGSTAGAYMRAVVRFYKFYLIKGEHFERPPFQFEELSMKIGNDETNMAGERKILVQTTDIRPRIPKNKAGIIPNKLRSLPDHEWKLLDHLLRVERKVLKAYSGKLIKCSLPIEFTLIFLLMRHTGLRREEAMTFNEDLLINIVSRIGSNQFVNVEIGPVHGVATKNSKVREIEIPVPLIRQLHKYTLTARYIKRRDKFSEKCANDSRIPLFISQQGNQMAISTINARWSEIRNYMQHKLGGGFTHKPHNLRSTYAVKRLFSLLDAGMSQSMSLEHIQQMLGHEKLATTFHYLSQLESTKSPEELAEIALDHMYEIAQLEKC